MSDGEQTFRQGTEFLSLFILLPEADQSRWWELWERPEIQISQIRSQEVIRNLSDALGKNKGNENQGKLEI